MAREAMQDAADASESTDLSDALEEIEEDNMQRARALTYVSSIFTPIIWNPHA